MEDEPRRIAGRYRILARIGSGGMGTVWRAFDETLRRDVAIKEVHFPATISAEDRAMMTARAMSEARNAARLHHPNIVAVHDVVSDQDQRPCIVMQLVVGQTLVESVTSSGRVSPVRAAEIGLALLEALGTAHASGIVHRDVKPSNVLLASSGGVLLSDFSIAIAAGEVGLTQTGVMVGTPGYVSPERITTGSAGPPADLFGLGATLYFAVEGVGPFDNPEPVAALFAAATKPHPAPTYAGDLGPVLDGLLIKEPAERWTIDQTRAALRSLISNGERAASLPTLVQRPPSATEHAPTQRGPVRSPSAAAARTQVVGPSAAGQSAAGPSGPRHPAAGRPDPRPAGAGPTARRSPAGPNADRVAESWRSEAAATATPTKRRSRRGVWLSVAVVVVLAVAAVVAMNLPPGRDLGGGDPVEPSPIVAAGGAVIDYEGATPTPAAAVPGARRGGVLTVLQGGQFAHLDPARIYLFDEMSAASLMHRSLTGYLGQTLNGRPNLVGDLATNAGETADGGKTWTYHLRPGIKFSDGTPITSADIAYGISRSFTPSYSEGLPYLQNLLDPRRVYKGPTAAAPLAPGLSTPDAQTIVFSLGDPVMTLPFLVALPNTVPVPKAKDTKLAYDRNWVSSGPYQLKEYTTAKLTLERNPSWDPNSDPIRTAYPDSFVFDFNANNKAARIVNGAGGDANAVMTGSITPALIGVVKANSEAVRRVEQAAGPFMRYLVFNLSRVRDIKVRQAINFAIDREAIVNLVGGSDMAAAATTILSPAMPGHKAFDLYPGGSKGDPAEAKKRLEGVSVGPLRLCYSDTSGGGDIARSVETSLESIGLTIETEGFSPDTYYSTIAGAGTTCDLMMVGWGADYPDGYATLGELFDGARSGDSLGNNYAHLDQKQVNDRLRELLSESDRSKAAAGYGELDEMIMREYAPVVPIFNYRVFEVFGKGVGNASINARFGTFGLNGVYVTS